MKTTVFRKVSIVAAILLITLVLTWDVIAMAISPADTISSVLSKWNVQSGGLLALVFIALWIHWFAPIPACWM